VLLRFLIGYGEIDPRLSSGAGEAILKFRRIERGGRKGFQVLRAYGGVEAFVGELWIGESVARFNVSREELRRRVEEAIKMAPDLSGVRKIWQTLEWLNTDVSFAGKWIEAATAHTWQAAWYIALFGEPESISGRADVAEEGIKPNVTMRWRRERLDSIIAEEGEELKSLLGRAVKSWRELVDAIDWRWVLERVEELADALKPWIGREGASDEEREGLARRMLGELALLTHFAEARRGMDDSRWREERAKRLAKAVEALGGGRIRGEYADRLAELIISYAERHDEETRKHIENLAKELTGVSWEEVWGVVDFVLSDMYCLARDCARDAVVRKFVAPALELIMLDKAVRDEYGREKARLLFGEMYATAVAGDGSVGPDGVKLVVGGELGGGAALLRLAALLLLNQLLPDKLKFNMRIYVGEGRYYIIAATGENAARFKRLLAVSAPSAGGEHLSPKFDELVKAAKVEVRLDENSIRLTDGGNVAADLIISEAGAAVKYNVYLRDRAIELHLVSSDQSHAELAALLLRLAGVSAEVKKVSDRDVWQVWATTDKLAAGCVELRNAVRKVVEEALKKGWVDEKKARRWLKRLEVGRVLMEGWPKYLVRLTRSGALEVKYQPTDPDSIEWETQRLENMGLVKGVHFSVKMPEGGGKGYVNILKEGLAYAAWLSVHGSGRQRELAAEFVEYILQRAKEEGDDVYEKAKEIVEEGKARGPQTLKGFEREVELDGKKYVVKVRDGEAVEEDKGGKKLLRLKIKAEVGRVEGEHTIVDRVVREYTITYGRYGSNNAAKGFAYASAKAPGGREADAERFAAVVKALTGKKPRIRRRSNGTIELECYERHLEGFARFAGLAEAIVRWLEETGQ